jgi:hypothetical protein
MFASEDGYSGYPDARSAPMGDLWDYGGAYGGEYAQRTLRQGVATVINAPNKLRLRSEPSTDSETLAYMPDGSQVVVYEQRADGWWDVEYYGTRGFASGQYLQMGSRAGSSPAPIPPYEPPAPPSPIIDPPDEVTPPPEPAKSRTAWYVVGALAAAAAAYYLV